ncbi:hypothetical protein [Bacillus sp. 165]|uniref:hypothetical protein n=1 Tax=Bacillus sp. 165 TaxID=1529117 RepID=UPI001ADCFBA5|nr:hypothetical protein [Bacillus sp. 165]MBO9129919.1 hypothetical protein [Bacillus sp. 165]
MIFVLFFLIAVIQALYAFTKYSFTPAVVITAFSWMVLLVLVMVIRKDKKRRETN